MTFVMYCRLKTIYKGQKSEIILNFCNALRVKLFTYSTLFSAAHNPTPHSLISYRHYVKKVSFVNEASHFSHKRPLLPKHNSSGLNGLKRIEWTKMYQSGNGWTKAIE